MTAFKDYRLRFWMKVDVAGDGGCWLWTAYRDREGYGRMAMGKQREGTFTMSAAHRLSYEMLVGPIGEGLHIDHLCRVRHCVNPEHLEPVTCRENVVRGVGPTAANAGKTHCKHGHPFSPENTYVNGQQGRRCKTCVLRIQAAYKRRVRAQAA